MTKKRRIYQISIALLLCLMQTAGIAMYGQSRPRAAAKRIHRLQADSLAAVRQAARMQADSLNRTMEEVPPLQAVAPADSIATADSIAAENKKKLLEMTSAPVLKESEVPADSLKKRNRSENMGSQPYKSHLAGARNSRRRTNLQPEILEIAHILRRLCRMCLCLDVEQQNVQGLLHRI